MPNVSNLAKKQNFLKTFRIFIWKYQSNLLPLQPESPTWNIELINNNLTPIN